MALEDSGADEVGQRYRRLEGLSDGIAEVVAGQAISVVAAPGMHEQEHPQIGGGGPERFQVGVGEVAPTRGRGDLDTPHAEALDGVDELAYREPRMLQRHGPRPASRPGAAATRSANPPLTVSTIRSASPASAQ